MTTDTPTPNPNANPEPIAAGGPAPAPARRGWVRAALAFLWGPGLLDDLPASASPRDDRSAVRKLLVVTLFMLGLDGVVVALLPFSMTSVVLVECVLALVFCGMLLAVAIRRGKHGVSSRGAVWARLGWAVTLAVVALVNLHAVVGLFDAAWTLDELLDNIAVLATMSLFALVGLQVTAGLARQAWRTLEHARLRQDAA